MMKTIIKNLINFVLTMNLVITPAFASTTAPVSEERTLDKIDTFLKSGAPSDVPFIEYMEDFTNTSTQPLKRFDLSSFEGKRIFLGYGIYDKGQNFCKYVEKPGMDDPALHFENITTFNKHSYAISMTTMNYDTCLNLANSFNGKPVMITSAAENGFVSGKYGGKSKWLGMNRNSCSEPYYLENGDRQEYLNWSSVSEQGSTCAENKRHTVQNQYGTWNKVRDLELNHCVVEVDTMDISRPIKICAPWWRIEREYKNETQTSFYGVDVYKINQADIPEQFNVCTKYEEAAIQEAREESSRKVTCTSYYDSTVAPECLRNPHQDICHVDECNGYIKNACRLTDTVETYKDYTKAEAILSGAKTLTKGKSSIKTHVYECPASLPSLKHCEEQSQVIIFPKECPNSSCEGYKECVQLAEDIPAKNACAASFPCEKIYGNPDNVLYKADGSIDVLRNTCSDGTVLEFEPSVQSKSSKKCLAYDMYTIEEEVSQKCVLERAYNDYSIDTSLTEEDIYMNNPQCIRMNNVEEARPTIQVMFKYKNFGMAQTVVKKTYLDGAENIDIQDGSDIQIVDAAMNPLDPFENMEQDAQDNAINSVGATANCSPFSQNWATKTGTILDKEIVSVRGANTYRYLADYLGMDSNGDYYAKYLDVLDAAMCTTIQSEINGTRTNYQTISKVCKVYLNKSSGDMFSLVEGIGSLQNYTDSDTGEVYKEYSDYSYTTKDSISEDDCKDISYCLNGSYNKSAYTSAALSQCKISAGDNYEFETEPILQSIDSITPDGYDENCKPLSTDGSYLSQLDGTQDIFSIQEVVTGDWGYFSNYNSHPIVNNIVQINDKEVYPLMPIPILDDPLIYEGDIDQTSILSSSPNIVAGAIGGAAAGVAAVSHAATYAALTATGVGVLVVVVFVIVAVLFGKKKKYNEQEWQWTIYKLVPQQRYLANIYGYDHRILTLNNDGSVYVDGGNNVKLIYAENYGHTGTLEPSDFKVMINNIYTQKESLLTCMGWMKTDVANITHSAEKDVIVGYPSCKKWSWSCDKRNTEHFDHDRNPFYKRMANNYLGAVNGVSIVVPYLGDYQLEAYDQFDNLLGQIKIAETDFRETTADVSSYAQVMFGLEMDLADGITDGLEDNACRYDLMTEWGGGVSGIYFENNNTTQNSDCQKSHDGYVKSSSATKIKIKSTSTDRFHVVDLIKPLPFANRVFLVTLNEKEIRDYRCYDEFGECKTDNYSSDDE